MKKKILLSPLLIIVLIAVFGVGVAGAAIYFGTSSGGETNTEGVNLQKGLVGHWKFDGNVKDSTANSNHGTVTGNVAATATDRKGQVNKAATFDGTGDYISVGNAASLHSSSLSVGLWFNVNNLSATRGLIGRFNGTFTSEENLIRVNTDGQVQVNFRANSANNKLYSNAGDITAGNWYHLMATFTQGTQKLYLNGVLEDTETVNDWLEQGGTNTVIGYEVGYENYMNGSIDGVRIYNRALSASEVTALYQEYDPGIVVSDLQKGLVGNWKFNGNAKDSTANSNHGTVTGAILTTDRKEQMNKAYIFDGTSNYIDMGDVNAFDFGINNFTIGIWIKPLGETVDWNYQNPILSKGTYSDGFVLWNENGSLAFAIDSSLGIVKGGDFTSLLDKWTYIVAKRDDNVVYLYIDGEQVDSDPTDDTVVVGNASSFLMGKLNNYFNGLIDDVRIYNRALSATEITALYQEYDPSVQISDLQKGLVGHWKLDGNAKDSTANSKHGTVTGTTLATDRKGQLNKAYSFDGLDDYIVAGNMGIPQNGPATLSGWFYLTQDAMSKGDHNYLWGAHAPGTGEDAILLQHEVNNYLYMPGADYFIIVPPTSQFPLNQWLHIVLTYSGDTSTAKLYVNNVSYAMNLQGGASNITALSNFRISSYYSTANYAWSGSIDDVRVYNRVLSPAEITALYESY